MQGQEFIKRRRARSSVEKKSRIVGAAVNGTGKGSKKRRVSFSDDPPAVFGEPPQKKQTSSETAEDVDDTRDEEFEQGSAATPVIANEKAKKPGASKGNAAAKARAKKPEKNRVNPSTKEQLAEMNKRERKAFIKSLAEKNKPNYHVAEKAKVLWEKIRSSRTEAEEKESCIAELRSLVKGKAKALIYAHDTCRVIECLLALKRDDIRNELFEELSSEIALMAKSKYAKFFVARMFKYGSKEQRDQLISAFRGHCVRMLSISTASKILETAYNDYANAEQRMQIVGEFYGPEYSLLAQELGGKGLPSINLVSKAHPTILVAVVRSLEAVLEKALRRETLKLSLTHRLLLNYLTHCSSDQRKSVVDSIKDHLPEIIHTREGSRVGMMCIWHADNEERKAIVKSFKGLAVKSCCDEFARRAIFAIFDCIEDTELVKKFITKDIANNIGEIINDKFGVWVLHYLVHPRDYRVFGKGLVEILKQADSVGDRDRTRGELYVDLFGHVRGSLYQYLGENMRDLIFNKTSSALVLDALEPDGTDRKRALMKKEKRPCFKAIAEIVGADEFDPSPESPHIIKSGCGRFVLRKLLQLDSKQEGVKLSEHLAGLPIETLNKFTAINSGCFALLEMWRSGSMKAREKLHELNLEPLKDSELIGAKLLYQELSAAALD